MNPRRVFLAWEIARHHRGRFALGAAAVGVAVLIMVMELGFFHGLSDSQAVLPPLFDADLVLMNAQRTNLTRWTMVPGTRLAQAAALPGVTEVIPIYNAVYRLRLPGTLRERDIYVLAFDPKSHALRLPGLAEILPRLEVRGTVLFDRRSRDIYGSIREGGVIELNRELFTVGGFFDLGPSFTNDGTLLMSDATYRVTRGDHGTELVDWALVRLQPGTEVEAFRARLLAALPPDVSVLTPEEMRSREVRYIARAVPIGIIFGIALAVGFLIGVIVCYQALFNEITDQLPQLATLKAMGFNDRYLSGLVLRQAFLIGVVGFVPGLAAGWLLCVEIQQRTQIVLRQTPERILVVFALTLLMCLVAGLLALRRATRADPAEIFGPTTA